MHNKPNSILDLERHTSHGVLQISPAVYPRWRRFEVPRRAQMLAPHPFLINTPRVLPLQSPDSEDGIGLQRPRALNWSATGKRIPLQEESQPGASRPWTTRVIDPASAPGEPGWQRHSCVRPSHVTMPTSLQGPSVGLPKPRPALRKRPWGLLNKRHSVLIAVTHATFNLHGCPLDLVTTTKHT